jgi:hypothetical protein
MSEHDGMEGSLVMSSLREVNLTLFFASLLCLQEPAVAELLTDLQRFAQRDPLGVQSASPQAVRQSQEGRTLYLYGMARPNSTQDPTGLICCAKWRRNPIHGFGRTKFHIGLDIDFSCRNQWNDNLDYGWSGNTWFDCCSENERWTQPAHIRAPHAIDLPDPAQGDYSDSFVLDECICIKLRNAPDRMGRYCLAGVPLDPCCSNSNGAMNKIIQDSNAECPTGLLPILPPGWAGPGGFDGPFPGWDNLPNMSPLCHCPPWMLDF